MKVRSLECCGLCQGRGGERKGSIDKAGLPHAVVPCAGAGSKYDGELGYICTSYRSDELRAILGDATLFGVRTYHEAADVLEKDERNASLGA